MAKNRLTDWDTTAANNTDVGGINIDEGWPPENVNNAARETMSQLAEFHGDITGKLTTTNVGNAYSVTTNDGITAYAAGQRYTLVINAANTGAATLNINTIGAKSWVKNHDLPLIDGDLEANMVVDIAYEATDDTIQLLSPVAFDAKTAARQMVSANGVLAPAKNLVVTNGATAASQLDIDADEVLLSDGTDFLLASSVNETADITASGANGLDTGAEANSTWYHAWVIGKSDGTIDSLLSASATAPTMPGGYTFKGYAGAIYNDGSGNFISISQIDRYVACALSAEVTNGVATSYTGVTGIQVPTTAKIAYGYARPQVTSGTLSRTIFISPTNGTVGEIVIGGYTPGDQYGMWRVPLIETQKFYYRMDSAASANADIWVSGWEF